MQPSTYHQYCPLTTYLNATSTLSFNTYRDGDSSTSLGSLFQCLSTLSEKKFFLTFNLNLPCHNLRPFPFVLSLLPGRRGQLPPCHNLLSGYCREWWCLPWASSWWKRHVPVFPWQIAMWDVENSNTAQRFKDVHKKSVSHWKNTCVCTSLFNSVNAMADGQHVIRLYLCSLKVSISLATQTQTLFYQLCRCAAHSKWHKPTEWQN